MKIKEIESLAAMMQQYGLTRMEITEQGSVILERKAPEAQTAAATVLSYVQPETETAAPAADIPAEPEQEEGEIISSPMVGVFYTAASPEADPFVKKGDMVQKGDVLCIIEAMKLMNEINAEQDGEILEVLAQNGQLVEYGQPLFRIR